MAFRHWLMSLAYILYIPVHLIQIKGLRAFSTRGNCHPLPCQNNRLCPGWLISHLRWLGELCGMGHPASNFPEIRYVILTCICKAPFISAMFSGSIYLWIFFIPLFRPWVLLFLWVTDWWKEATSCTYHMAKLLSSLLTMTDINLAAWKMLTSAACLYTAFRGYYHQVLKRGI